MKGKPSQSRPNMLLLAAAGCAALLGCGWSWTVWQNAAKALAMARNTSNALQHDVQILQQLRQSGTPSSIGGERVTNVGTFLEGELAQASLPPSTLSRVTPDAPREVAGGRQQLSYEIDLRGMTLAQSVQILERIEAPEQRLIVDDLRLSAATDAASADRWNLGLRIGQMVRASENERSTRKRLP